MPSVRDRLRLLIDIFDLPNRIQKGDRLSTCAQIPVLKLDNGIERDIPEVRTCYRRKMEMFGYLGRDFYDDDIFKIAINLARTSWGAYRPSHFFDKNFDGSLSLNLETVECRAFYDSVEDATYYFLLPKLGVEARTRID